MKNITGIYDELRTLAMAQLAKEDAGHSLQATALVHEAYLRLQASPGKLDETVTRSEYFRAAAVAMQRILVDHARAKRATKRGGGQERVAVDPDCLADAGKKSDVLAVHEALEAFRVVDAQAAELVTLRYFGGMTLVEAAEVLGVSVSTADRWWLYAKTWLYQRLQG